MDVRVDNFLDFCKIFYPSRYRLEMKKPGFDFSLLEAEVRENGGIDVNNIFFNGFCVEETEELNFDNFDIQKQLDKLDNDLDKAKYLTDCLYIIFSLPPLPFLPEKDLSVTPYYTIEEIFYAFKDNKIFGINVFDAIIFVYNEFDKNKQDDAPFIVYLKKIKLINFVYNFLNFKHAKGHNENQLIELIHYQFFTVFKYCLFNNFFNYTIEEMDYGEYNYFINTNNKEASYENPEIYEFNYNFNKFNYELFKKNKFYMHYDLFIDGNGYINESPNNNIKNISFRINFKTLNNSNQYTLNFPFAEEKNSNMILYFPSSLTSNINDKINLKSYNKSEKVFMLVDSSRDNIIFNNETLTGTYDNINSNSILYKFLKENFKLSFSKKIEEGYLNLMFTFYPTFSYFLLNKEDLIDKNINNFGPRYANKIRKYLVKNSNNSITNPISDEDAGIPNGVT